MKLLAKKQSGVALLEVLIAFIIVTVSMVALYQLHSKYIQTEISSSARLSALHLAQSKLDDLRTFSSLTSTTSAANDGLPSYDGMDDDVGGTLAAGSHAVGNFNYDLHWLVSPASGGNDITVIVSGTNNTEQIQLSGYIARIEKISEDRLTNTSTVNNIKPIVNYVSGAAPDVISIELDDEGTKQETTKPLPEVANNGGSISSKFSTITYDSGNTQVESDFNTISCSCTYTSDNTSYLPAYPYLTDTDLLYWKVGSSISKKRGTVANNQPTLCSVCCENHFDNASNESSSFVNYYNQFNRNAGKYNNSGSSLSAAANGSYIDSCRLLRIDGYYRPMPDWNLVKLNVMSASYLSDTNNVAQYQAYIKDVVTSYIELAQSVTWGDSSDNRSHFGLALNKIDTSTIPTFSAWLQSHNYSTTALTMTLGDTPIQLIARGIFIDLLNTVDTNGDATSVNASELDLNDSALLKKVPFYDINMTLLSRWTSASAAVSVANEVIKTLDSSDTDYYGVYRRGYITPVSVTASGGVNITAEAYQGNSSVAAYQYSKNNTEIAVSDFESNYARSGSINITVSSSAVSDGTVSIIGKIYCYDAKNNGGTASCKQGQTNYLSNISIQGTAASCQLESVANETSYLLYNCKVTPPATNSRVSVSTSATGFIVNPSSARDLSLELNGTTSPVTGKCFNVYSNSITDPLPTTCPYP